MDGSTSTSSARTPHWSVMRLGAARPMQTARSGLAILWSGHDVHVAHGAREFHLRAGDLAIVDRSQALRIAGDDGWSANLLDLGDRRMAARMDDRNRFVAMPFDGTTPLATIVKRAWTIGEDVGTLMLGDDVIDGHLAALMTHLAGKLVAQAVDLRLSSPSAAAVERARVLIDANLADPGFGVSVLAERMRISSRHLSSLFASIGTTTTEAILDARLERGRAMLSDPAAANRQIAAVARACGFEDQGYFARRFRQKFGLSPRRFRENTGQL